MQAFNHYHDQLPNFIQAELVWYVGSHHGLSLVQILARHITAVDYWMAQKNRDYRPHPDHSGIFGNGPLGKQEMEALKSLVDSQMSRTPLSSFAQGLISRLTKESVLCLTQLKNNLLVIQIRADAEEAMRYHALHQAEETARQLARQQAETAAQQLAEAAEIARQHARRRAEERALSVLRPRIVEVAITQLIARLTEALGEDSKIPAAQPASQTIISVTGPKSIAADLSRTLFEAEGDIRAAIADFSKATGPTIQAFSAMLYAFKQNGLDTQAIGESVLTQQ